MYRLTQEEKEKVGVLLAELQTLTRSARQAIVDDRPSKLARLARAIDEVAAALRLIAVGACKRMGEQTVQELKELERGPEPKEV